jgi:hypothetical protein
MSEGKIESERQPVTPYKEFYITILANCMLLAFAEENPEKHQNRERLTGR